MKAPNQYRNAILFILSCLYPLLTAMTCCGGRDDACSPRLIQKELSTVQIIENQTQEPISVLVRPAEEELSREIFVTINPGESTHVRVGEARALVNDDPGATDKFMWTGLLFLKSQFKDPPYTVCATKDGKRNNELTTDDKEAAGYVLTESAEACEIIEGGVETFVPTARLMESKVPDHAEIATRLLILEKSLIFIDSVVWDVATDHGTEIFDRARIMAGKDLWNNPSQPAFPACYDPDTAALARDAIVDVFYGKPAGPVPYDVAMQAAETAVSAGLPAEKVAKTIAQSTLTSVLPKKGLIAAKITALTQDQSPICSPEEIFSFLNEFHSKAPLQDVEPEVGDLVEDLVP